MAADTICALPGRGLFLAWICVVNLSSTRMNQLLRNIFLGLAALLIIYAALFANYLHEAGTPSFRSKIIWLAIAGAVFLVVAGLRFSIKTKSKIFAVLFSLLLVEMLLQAAAWLGVLPAVNTKLKAPFARIYWTSEGHGNDVRNRFGWHYPQFDLQSPKRIAVIGDSFVEAVEVGRNQNEAADLQRLLRARSPEWSVLAFGTHGTSPAFHLDVFDYARRHFAPQEVLVLVYLGNDINESSPPLNYVPAENYIYYDLDSGGRLVLNPASATARDQFDRGLEFSHKSWLVTLPVVLNSHCMTLQLADSLRDSLLRRRRIPQMAAADAETAAYGRVGLSLKPYAVPTDPEAQRAMSVMLAELAELKQKCAAGQIRLRLVTIPFFPPQFYATQHGADWSLKLGKYDFLSPDRQIADFAQSHEIPFLSFADWLLAKKIGANEIRGLYFNDGSGHFTERGHSLCAEAMFTTFYAQP